MDETNAAAAAASTEQTSVKMGNEAAHSCHRVTLMPMLLARSAPLSAVIVKMAK